MAEANNINSKPRPKCGGHLCSIRWQKNDAQPLHECPYQSAVNGRLDYTCQCCDSCRQNCADDV